MSQIQMLAGYILKCWSGLYKLLVYQMRSKMLATYILISFQDISWVYSTSRSASTIYPTNILETKFGTRF